MGKSSRKNRLAAALAKLKAFRRKWESVKIRQRFVVEQGHRLANPPARGEAIKAAAKLFDELGPLASRVIIELGIEVFSDIPDPPDILGLHDSPSDVGRRPTILTGSPDTREAGRRILFWAAAAHDPDRWHRAKGFSQAVRHWTRWLICRMNENGDFRLLHQPIDWAVEFAVNTATAMRMAVDAGDYALAGDLADAFGFKKLREFYDWLDSHNVEHFAKGRRHWVHRAQFLKTRMAEQKRKQKESETSLLPVIESVGTSHCLSDDSALTVKQKERRDRLKNTRLAKKSRRK
jgi:hypothetical protein